MKLKVSPLFIIMAFFAVFFGYGYELLSYVITIVLHEMAHAEAARKLGYSLNVIKLMPHGASLTGEFEGVKAGDEVLIALAGPAVNAVLAVVCVALWWLIPQSYFFTETFVTANVVTAVFNMLPIFPLDGGRAALALLSVKVKREKAYRILRIVGAVFALVFAASFAMSLITGVNFSFAAIAVFIFVSTVFPDKNSKYQRLYSMAFRLQRLKRGLPVKEIMVSENSTAVELMRMLNANYFCRFLVLDENFSLVGTIDELELESIAVKHDSATPVKKLLNMPKSGK